VGQLSGAHDRDRLWVEAFAEAGMEVHEFDVLPYERPYPGFWGKIKNRFSFGTSFSLLQKTLVSTALRLRPDVIHYRMPVRAWASTVGRLRSHGFIQTCYYNDDPFSISSPWGIHFHLKKALPLFQHHFLFRRKNIADFSRMGIRNFSLLPPFFPDAALQRPRERLKISYDGVFIGHWENDGRQQVLESLVKKGMRIQIYGSVWDKKATSQSPLQGPFSLLFAPDSWAKYRESLASLCFYSKMNNDQWTRRPLEIVAAGGLLVSERTPEAQSHFKENEEALYFSDAQELFQQMQRLRREPELRHRLRERGLVRLRQGRYSLRDRVQEVLETWTSMGALASEKR